MTTPVHIGILSPHEIRAIRNKLGWSCRDMAAGLALSGKNSANTIREWEMDPSCSKARAISGSAAMAMLAFLEGFIPPEDEEIAEILARHGIAQTGDRN
jgi:DNA-binding transcriptional regulator YiaG